MAEKKRSDLRTKRTQTAIRKAFREMLSEMDFVEVTIKELTSRANISRRTFYMYYSTLDELLDELIDEIADNYTKKTHTLNGHYNLEEIVRTFLLYFSCQDELHERIICIIAYLNESALGMYRKWIADKKLLPLEDFVNIATQLICSGAAGFRNTR